MNRESSEINLWPRLSAVSTNSTRGFTLWQKNEERRRKRHLDITSLMLTKTMMGAFLKIRRWLHWPKDMTKKRNTQLPNRSSGSLTNRKRPAPNLELWRSPKKTSSMSSSLITRLSLFRAAFLLELLIVRHPSSRRSWDDRSHKLHLPHHTVNMEMKIWRAR